VRCGQHHSSFRETSRLIPSEAVGIEGLNRNGKPLRHPKSGATLNSSTAGWKAMLGLAKYQLSSEKLQGRAGTCPCEFDHGTQPVIV
jgi:hypothetical protein